MSVDRETALVADVLGYFGKVDQAAVVILGADFIDFLVQWI